MSVSVSDPWIEGNRRALRAALVEVQAALIRYIEATSNMTLEDGPGAADSHQNGEVTCARAQHGTAEHNTSRDATRTATLNVTRDGRPDLRTTAEPDGMLPDGRRAEAGAPFALDTVCAAFGLSPFERQILVLCAGIELDATFGPLCAAAHGDSAMAYPTFGLAMAALPDPEWSALAPSGHLRRWQLVDLGEAHALTRQPLRIDERIVHYLVGLPYSDDVLLDIGDEASGDGHGDLVPSHRATARRIAAIWAQVEAGGRPPAIELCGSDAASKRTIAVAACREVGISLLILRAHALPVDPASVARLKTACERQARLNGSVLYLDCDDLETPEPVRDAVLTRLIERYDGYLLVANRQRSAPGRRIVVPLDVSQPTSAEQAAEWRRLLGGQHAWADQAGNALAGQFDLSVSAIQAIHGGVVSDRPAEQEVERRRDESLTRELWDACRAYTRPELDQLAQRIEPRAGWTDLVLPEQQLESLREICMHVRHRRTVYDNWELARKSARGLGITALFSGSSGTGKTMAAEVLANELRLDLYRVDLSATVSKYIGETEKNLRRIFDAADAGGALLLFDEADALFGKRSDVKDSHDRYANIEVSYLLQRVEAYRGLAILTTNLKDSLDRAFMRRLRFVVEFPFPGVPERVRIWERIFPAAVPTESLDLGELARLNLAGGNIRNIAMNAAFLAADADQPVQMGHLLRAARSELAKLEKPLAGAGVRARG